MEIIIEELSYGHKVLGRHKFSTNNISIGRGYDNDIIISDPHVCAKHLHLQFDGENWFIEDQDSINGSFLENIKKNLIRHKVQSGDIISIGKSQVRFIFPNHPVAESITVSPFESLITLVRHPAVVTFNIILFAIIACWTINLNNVQEVSITQLLVPSIGLTLGFFLWPIALALLSHLTKHDSRFFSQLGICFVFFNLMWINDFIEYIIQFNTSSNVSVIGLIIVIPLLIAFGLFWFNCYIGFHMTLRRRNIVSASLVALLFGGNAIIELSQKPDFNPHPKFNTTIISPMFLFAPSSNLESFVNDSRKLFKKVNEEIEEAQENNKAK